MAQETCLACDQSSEKVPLVALVFQGETKWICPQHLPLLIHDPQRLAGRLPGAESMSPAETHD